VTKHDNINKADGVIGLETAVGDINSLNGWKLDVWHLEDTNGDFTYYIRTDSTDPTTQEEIFDVHGNPFTQSTLPHSTEELYIKSGDQFVRKHQLFGQRTLARQ
jgi:hypothetical protein